MNNASGGNVIYHFKGDTKDLDSKTSKIASGVSSAFKVATGAVIATTTAVAGLVGASVKGYAEFEQLEGGLVSLFGEGSNEMNKIIESSEQAYKDLTMSQNDYLNAFETAYPLVNSGLAKNKDAIEYTNKVLQVSSDLFNTYGGSTEQYQSAINWALKGTFSYLDNLNLGIKGTQEGFIEAANASGVLSKKVKDVSELTNDQIIDVIMHYADAYGVLGKTASEAGSTIQGSLNMTKSAWSNFIVGFSKDGADMGALVDNLIGSALKFGNNLLPVIERALGSIADALPSIVEKIVGMLPGLLQKVLPGLVQGAISLLKSLSDALPGLIPVLMDGIVQAVKGLVAILPQLIPVLMDGIVQAVKGLVAILPQVIQALIQGLILIMQALAEEAPTLIPVLVDAILEIIPMLLDNLPLFINAGLQLIMGIAEGLIKAVPRLIASIPKIIKSLLNSFTNPLGIHSPSTVFADIGINLIKGLWNGIANVTDWIIGKIKGFGKSVLKAIKGIFGVHSPSTEFEWIGKMNMVGLEQGMEGMKNQVQGTIDSMFNLQPNVSGQMSSTYSPNMVINVQNNMKFDPIGQLVNNVKTFSGGAKNDYNWGAGL